MALENQVSALIERQLRDWPLARGNDAALDSVAMRGLSLGAGEVILQHNPGRIRSTAADVTAGGIKSRDCFLCREHQPPEQEALEWRSAACGKVFRIQLNPYPIFHRHLTIASLEHEPQRCHATVMQELAEQLPGFTVLFNGAGCGASAPDHLHFQAVPAGSLPLCGELERRAGGNVDSCYGTRNLWMDDEQGRQLVYIRAELLDSAIVSDMSLALQGQMRNALCWFGGGVWHLVLFPRRRGRPSCYGTGEGQLLVSPAAVEYGGVWVLPRREDFERVTAEDIRAIYREVSIDEEEMRSLYDRYVRVN